MAKTVARFASPLLVLSLIADPVRVAALFHGIPLTSEPRQPAECCIFSQQALSPRVVDAEQPIGYIPIRKALSDSARLTPPGSLVVPGTQIGLDQDVTVFPGVYPPHTASSELFRRGIHPRPGSIVLNIGAGPGADTLLMADRGAAKVFATEKSHTAKLNLDHTVAASLYADSIVTAEADLFDFPAEFAAQIPREGFDQIYMNPTSVYESDPLQADPNMDLLRRLLANAGRYLKAGGTLEIPYLETPRFMEMAYELGWEPAVISGTDFSRAQFKGQFDYSYIVLVRAEAGGTRLENLSRLRSDWRQLAVIEHKRLQTHPLSRDDLDAMREIFARRLPGKTFEDRLLIKAILTIGYVVRMTIPDLRVNERLEDSLADILGIDPERPRRLPISNLPSGLQSSREKYGWDGQDYLLGISILRQKVPESDVEAARERVEELVGKYRDPAQSQAAGGPWMTDEDLERLAMLLKESGLEFLFDDGMTFARTHHAAITERSLPIAQLPLYIVDKNRQFLLRPELALADLPLEATARQIMVDHMNKELYPDLDRKFSYSSGEVMSVVELMRQTRAMSDPVREALIRDMRASQEAVSRRRLPPPSEASAKGLLRTLFFHEIGEAIWNSMPASLKHEFESLLQSPGSRPQAGIIAFKNQRKAILQKLTRGGSTAGLTDELFADYWAMANYPDNIYEDFGERLPPAVRRFMNETVKNYLVAKHARGNVWTIEESQVEGSLILEPNLLTEIGRAGTAQMRHVVADWIVQRARRISEVMEQTRAHAARQADEEGISETASFVLRALKHLTILGELLIGAYQELASVHELNPGSISLYLTGGRLKNKPLHDRSDLDMKFHVDIREQSLDSGFRIFIAALQRFGEIAVRFGGPLVIQFLDLGNHASYELQDEEHLLIARRLAPAT